MSKLGVILLGGLAAGASQFGLLVSAGVRDYLALSAGVIGAVGVAIAGLLKQLPRDEWTDEQRASKSGGSQ